jgi:uncharacterized membrane protein YhaH (DUF805 family)
MNFWQAIGSGYKNYVNFSGRAIRSEYWYWFLFTLLGGFATEILDAGIFSSQIPSASPLNGVFNLLTFLPSLAISVRRLHDIDRTGWWILIAFTIIGLFVLFYWACVKGTHGDNRFGPDPLPAEVSLHGAGRSLRP